MNTDNSQSKKENEPGSDIGPAGMLLQNEQFAKVLITYVRDSIKDENRKIWWRRAPFFGILAVAFLGLIGSATLEFIENRVLLERQNLSSQLKTELEILIGDLEEKLEASITYNDLLGLAEELDAKGSFSPGERNEIAKLLHRINQFPQYADRQRLAQAAEKIVDRFIAANIQQQLDEVLELLPHTVTDSLAINVSLIQHYAQSLMAKPKDSWNKTEIDAFQRSARILDQTYPEVSYPHRMLVLHRRLGLDYGGQNAEIAAMIPSLRGNNPGEHGNAAYTFLAYTHQACWTERDLPQPAIIEAVARTFLEKYWADIVAALGSVPEARKQLADRVMVHHLANSERERLCGEYLTTYIQEVEGFPAGR